MGVLYEKRGHVAYVTINNVEKANILDRETSNAIAEAWKEVWDDTDVRATILTGVGDRYFCAGHNLSTPAGITPEERERVRIENIFWPPSERSTAPNSASMEAWETTTPRYGSR